MLFQKRAFSAERQKGLTLIEVMTVLAILSILALFAGPDVINWRPRMWLKSASEDLYADMQRAKMHAIKNNVGVTLGFTAAAACPGGSYTFAENTPAATIVVSKVMANDVCLSASTFVAGDGFTPRGLPINGAVKTVTLTHERVAGVQYQVQQSVAGGLTLEKID